MNAKCLTDEAGTDIWAIFEPERPRTPVALIPDDDMQQIVGAYTLRQQQKGHGPLSAAAEAAVPAFVEMLGTAALDEAGPAEIARRAREVGEALALNNLDVVLALMQAMLIARQEDGGVVTSSDLLGGLGLLLDEFAGVSEPR